MGVSKREQVPQLCPWHSSAFAEGILTHHGGVLYSFKMTSFPYLHIFNRAMMNLLPLDSYFEL